MKESSSNQELALSIRASSQDEILLNRECFKARMMRLLRALDKFWIECRRLKRYGRDQWKDRGEWQ